VEYSTSLTLGSLNRDWARRKLAQGGGQLPAPSQADDDTLSVHDRVNALSGAKKPATNTAGAHCSHRPTHSPPERLCRTSHRAWSRPPPGCAAPARPFQTVTGRRCGSPTEQHTAAAVDLHRPGHKGEQRADGRHNLVRPAAAERLDLVNRGPATQLGVAARYRNCKARTAGDDGHAGAASGCGHIPQPPSRRRGRRRQERVGVVKQTAVRPGGKQELSELCSMQAFLQRVQPLAVRRAQLAGAQVCKTQGQSAG
jgi:hypothetical protein